MRHFSLVILAIALFAAQPVAAKTTWDDLLDRQFADIRSIVKTYCLECHSSTEQAGELELERFTSLNAVRKDVKPWLEIIRQLETGEMPPKDHLPPSADQRKFLIDWTRRMLDSESRARAGDPGHVPLHRLSNTEYNNTICDLTGVDLQPASEFPADGAAGEGFTNAAEALAMSPSMMFKYMDAANEVAAHAQLLPDGFRFSRTKTQRDWTDESLAKLRKFYWKFTRDGDLPLKPYITALVRHRRELTAGNIRIEEIGRNEELSPEYLTVVWEALNGKASSYPLDRVRTRWRNATEEDIDAIVLEISSWFESLWETVRVGSYVSPTRRTPKDPEFRESDLIKLRVEPTPGQSEVVLYLVSRDLGSNFRENTNSGGYVVWHNPHFEGDNSPSLALADYESYGAIFEMDYSVLFAQSQQYLAAAIEAANNKQLSLNELARKHSLDATLLERWITVLEVKPRDGTGSVAGPGRVVPAVSLKLLDEAASDVARTAIKGWKSTGAELPIVLSNASGTTEFVPGRISPHTIAVHPLPEEFVATVWKSPIKGTIRITGNVSHAHSSCGNGIAWWVEKQSVARSVVIAEGAVDLGKAAEVDSQEINIEPNDLIFLAIDAKNRSHECDLTEIKMTVTEIVTDVERASGAKGRVWDLATDIADNINIGNPQADKFGNPDVWRFVQGASRGSFGPSGDQAMLANSILAEWRRAAADPEKADETELIARKLQSLLTSPRPARDKPAERVLYDSLVSPDGNLLKGIDPSHLMRLAGRSAADKKTQFGLPKIRFGAHPLDFPVDIRSLVLPINEVTEIHLPAELFRSRTFVVEGKLDSSSDQQVVQFQVLTSPPEAESVLDMASPVVATTHGRGHRQLLAGLSEFRHIFPPNICYPHVIPLDEVVCLKTFHREDEPLIRLFLNNEQTRELQRLWDEHRFVTKFPVVENEYLPLFIGFVTQDQPKELVKFFEDKRPEFRQWADDFERDFEAAAPRQLNQLLEFAAQAYRRPLTAAEQGGLNRLYGALRQKHFTHEKAFRGVLARVLISPSFLLHLERSPPGTEASTITDWELASRLSYFLWSSMPDSELRQISAEGRLHEPEVLSAQVRRMLSDHRTRALAVEFGTQWIHVRGFDEFDEKNETLFPSFDSQLRKAIYEESILFFQDLFQNDRSVSEILDADYTFLNQRLAEHYGIPDVLGDHWRKVDGVRKYGRGGILAMASVQSKQAGASRTSPVLRGNWVAETLLGEKLPRPPKNVPQLPEEETGNGGLTMREIVEKHVSAAECAVCHQRIDPFGFAFEKYDPIGRLRETDRGGLPVRSHAKLRDGTEFDGLDGLRDYLVTQKGLQIRRLFCQRLLGYALGRSVTISDRVLIDEMMANPNEHDAKLTNLVLAIVLSKQFRMIRGSDFVEER